MMVELNTRVRTRARACLDEKNALRPVPEGKTRQAMYCGKCRYQYEQWGCLFDRKYRARERKAVPDT